MMMKWFGYLCCAVGFLFVVFGTTKEHHVGGSMFIGGGVLIWVIYRVMQRIDSDGSEEF